MCLWIIDVDPMSEALELPENYSSGALLGENIGSTSISFREEGSSVKN